MSALLDSEAQLRARAAEVGLSSGVIDAIVAAGASSLSSLAFSVGQPGQPVSTADVDAFLQTSTGRAPTLAEVAATKRLAFEAHTLLVASIRQVIDNRDDGSARKVGAAERETRMAAIRLELGGIQIVDENEPGHIVLDKACQIHESNNLKYLEPACCISRSTEVQGGTKSRELVFEGGSLVVKEKEDKTQAPIDTEMRLYHAFLRRGIAFRFARLMTFEQHSSWISFLFGAMHRDPPPGFSSPSLHQIMQCDRAAFARFGSTISSVRAREDGTYPLGEALLALRSDPMITLHLAPLQKTGSSGPPLRPSPYSSASSSQRRNDKGKGKGRKGKTPPMPVELRNKWYKTADGEPLCFAFNTARGCSSGVKDGERCSKGYHLCCEPKCLQPHSLQNHPRKGGA